MDVQLAADWTHKCTPVLVIGVTGHPRPGWDIGFGMIRLYVLDLPSGDTVTIVIDDLGLRDFQSMIDLAAPVVDSFRFLK